MSDYGRPYLGDYAGQYLGGDGAAVPAYADMALTVTASASVMVALSGAAPAVNGPSGGVSWLRGYYPKPDRPRRVRNIREELVLLRAA